MGHDSVIVGSIESNSSEVIIILRDLVKLGAFQSDEFLLSQKGQN